MEIDINLRKEVQRLVRYVARLRQEIATVAQDGDSERINFYNMSSQLDAIVVSTEEATNSIMDAGEKVLDASNSLQQDLNVEERLAAQNEIHEGATKVLEACSFQDLTGQRVNKILNSLQFVEERVEAMMKICESDAILALISDLPKLDEGQEDDSVPMYGPTNDGVSQDEIDALFD